MSYNINRQFAQSQLLEDGIYDAVVRRIAIWGNDPDYPSLYITLLVEGRTICDCWVAPMKGDRTSEESFAYTQELYGNRVGYLCAALGVDPNAVEKGKDMASQGTTRKIQVELKMKKARVFFNEEPVTKEVYKEVNGDRPLRVHQEWIMGSLFQPSFNSDGYPLYTIKRVYGIREDQE